MKIEIGTIYKNKTWRFLAPSLNYFGKTFIGWINTTYKLAVGVGDVNHINSVPSFYILMDSKYQPRNFEKFLAWLRYQEYFVDDYVFDSELEDSRKHMLVIAIPEIYIHTYRHLLKSEYSRMYTKDQVEGLFGAPFKDDAAILLKKNYAYTNFINKLNEEFDSNMTLDSFNPEEIEFDLPFNKEEEVFNYKKR